MLSITSLTHSFTRSCVHRNEKCIQHNNSCVPNSPLDSDDDDDVQLEAICFTSFAKWEIIDDLSSATDRLDCRYGDIFKDFPPFYSIIMIMGMSNLFADAWSRNSPNFKSDVIITYSLIIQSQDHARSSNYASEKYHYQILTIAYLISSSDSFKWQLIC